MIRREALSDQIMVSFDRSTGRIRMNSHIIKVIAVDLMVWFQGKQLALALGFKDPIKSMLTHVDDSDRQLLEETQHANTQHVPASGAVTASKTCSHWVNECGFYSLVFGSTLPSAKAFKAWVTREVLPATCRTAELLDTEQSLIKAYDGMPVVYMGAIEHPAFALAQPLGVASITDTCNASNARRSHDGTALVKIGCCDAVKEAVSEHKKEFTGFILLHVVPASNNRQVVKLVKEHPELDSLWLSATINGKEQTELLALHTSFKLCHLEAIIHRIVQANPLSSWNN